MNSLLLLFAALIPAGPLQISPEARDLIVEFETGGQTYYNARLQRPSWPGGASGVTIGVGYDVGYNSRAGVLSDWRTLPEGTRNALASAAGIKGVAAKSRAAALKWIIIPWADAEKLFVANTMPRFGTMTAQAFPGILNTHPHVQGVMLSTVFNRGASKSGARRREMAQSATAISQGEIRKLPALQRSMKRLWVGKGLPGLLRRYDAHARLIEKSF